MIVSCCRGADMGVEVVVVGLLLLLAGGLPVLAQLNIGKQLHTLQPMLNFKHYEDNLTCYNGFRFFGFCYIYSQIFVMLTKSTIQ